MKIFLFPVRSNESAVSVMAVTPALLGKTASISGIVFLGRDAKGCFYLFTIKNSFQQVIQQVKTKKNLPSKQCKSRIMARMLD